MSIPGKQITRLSPLVVFYGALTWLIVVSAYATALYMAAIAVGLVLTDPVDAAGILAFAAIPTVTGRICLVDWRDAHDPYWCNKNRGLIEVDDDGTVHKVHRGPEQPTRVWQLIRDVYRPLWAWTRRRRG